MTCEICGGKDKWTSLINKNNMKYKNAIISELSNFFAEFRKRYLSTMLYIDGYDLNDKNLQPKMLTNMRNFLNTVCKMADNKVDKTGKNIIQENKDLKSNSATLKQQISQLTNENEQLKKRINSMVNGTHFTRILKENFKLSKRDEVLKEIESDLPEDIKKINKRVDGIRRNWKNVDWKAIEKTDAEMEIESAKLNNKKSKISGKNNYIYIEENL